MDTQNPSPVEHPLIVPVISPLPVLVPPKKSGRYLLWALLFLVLLLSATVAFFVYQNLQLRQQLTVQLTPTPVSSATPLPTPDPMDDWKTFSGKTFSFKYPQLWEAKEQNNDYFESVFVVLNNSTQTVRLNVTPSQMVYGFGGDYAREKKEIEIEVGGKMYTATENLIDNRAVYVDQQVTIGSQKYFVLFGTGYPAGEDKKASLDDYQNEKENILKILSTFKFTN